MKMYFENVEEYLEEYSTLTKTLIFSMEGEVLFSEPPELEFARPHFRAALSSMADSHHPLVGIQVGDTIYKCLRVDDSLLVGRSDIEEFVAFKTMDILIVGFNDREKSGESCLKDVKDVAMVLFQPPDSEIENEVVAEPEEELVAQTTMLQRTTASPSLKKPRVAFSDGNAPVQHRDSKTKLIRSNLPDDQNNDMEVVNAAFESRYDEEDSYERIELQEAPRVTPEEIELTCNADGTEADV